MRAVQLSVLVPADLQRRHAQGPTHLRNCRGHLVESGWNGQDVAALHARARLLARHRSHHSSPDLSHRLLLAFPRSLSRAISTLPHRPPHCRYRQGLSTIENRAILLTRVHSGKSAHRPLRLRVHFPALAARADCAGRSARLP